MDKLAVKVKNLDSNIEEVSLQDIHMRKAFKSSTLFDQQVVSRDTIPAAMQETYSLGDEPPPLHHLNPYRWDYNIGPASFHGVEIYRGLHHLNSYRWLLWFIYV